MKRIVILQAHPDPNGGHFVHALANAYATGAAESGHAVKRVDIANLDFSLLQTVEDWEQGAPPEAIRKSQEAIAWSEHLVIVYPQWLGTMPALLKGFLEQVFRPGFALDSGDPEKMPKKLLKGKSARIVVTMGMPAFLYRWYFRAHSLKSLERNILSFCGIGPIRNSLIGLAGADENKRKRWLELMHKLGEEGR